MTGAVIEYARGLAVVKSFGKDGAAMATVTKAIDDSRKIHQKIEWGYVPGNALHLLARFYDPQQGDISVGGHNLREFTCDSLPIFRWYFKTYICSTIRFEPIYALASLTSPKKK